MEGEENKCKERVIMVGMDESEESTKALQWAFHRLSSPQDRLLIINAQRPASSYVKAGGPGQLYPFQAILVSGEMMKIFEEDIKRSTQKIFTRARDVCKEKNVVTETMAMTGDARDVLCDAVKKYKPDMLVVGSHGYGPIKRAFLGSVSDYCIHHAQCPVVVVKN